MKKFSLLFAFVLLMASCSENNLITPNPDSGEGVHTTLALSVAPMQGDKGDNVKSRSVIGVDENAVNCLWVLQFETQSKKLLKKSYLPITNLAKVDIVLAENAAGTTSNIYFVANMSRGGLANFYGDETAFQSASEVWTSELGTVTANGDYTTKTIPMCSNIPGITVGKYGVIGGITTQLIRMLARIDFTTSVNASVLTTFTPKYIRICNVPSMRYVSDVKCTAGAISTPIESVQVNASNSYSATYTFYVPGNLCGNNDNPAGSSDKYKTGVSTGLATYVELSGPALVDPYKGENIYFRIYPGENMTTNYDIKRNKVYQVTANLSNLSNLSNVLSSDRRAYRGGSNCYIVKPGESINIPIFRANLSALGDQIPDVYNSGCIASVYWEAGPDVTTNPTLTGAIVTIDNPNCVGGTFTVNANRNSLAKGGGNAVVCIKDASNNILWSWHIWVTNDEFNPTTNTLTTTNKGVSYTWMNRNLGALAVAGLKSPGVYNTFETTAGMMYQWGRKDPFWPGVNTSTSPVTPMVIAGTTAINLSYTKVKTAFGAPSATTAVAANDILNKATLAASGSATTFAFDKQLAVSVQAPALFLLGWGGSLATTAVTTAAHGKDSWNGDTKDLPKSIYDPCPVGWRVPSGFKGNNTSAYISPWSKMIGTPSPTGAGTLATPRFYANSGSTLNAAYCDWGSNSGDYGRYPASGCRDFSEGAFLSVGTYGFYWSGSVNTTDGYRLSFYSGNVSPSSSSIRAGGYPVRCVQE